MYKKIKILSLFDGISCARVAVEKLGINIGAYYSSEIDENAIKIARKNYPDSIQVGDIRDLFTKKQNVSIAPDIDLLIGGSPCQDLSRANTKGKGLKGEKSSLFYEYLRILKEIKPKYFILENVASMKKEYRDIISKELGVEPIMIDAGLVSAQTRKRLFWTNIKNIETPKDRNILLGDIIDTKADAKLFLSNTEIKKILSKMGKDKILPKSKKGYFVIPEATKKGYAIAKEGYSIDLSFPTSKTRRGRVGNKIKNLMTSQNIYVVFGGRIRKISPVESERAQCLPSGYTSEATDNQRYKVCGNAFNVEVVRHILSFVKKW